VLPLDVVLDVLVLAVARQVFLQQLEFADQQAASRAVDGRVLRADGDADGFRMDAARREGGDQHAQQFSLKFHFFSLVGTAGSDNCNNTKNFAEKFRFNATGTEYRPSPHRSGNPSRTACSTSIRRTSCRPCP